MLFLASTSLVLALISAVLFVRNLALYRPPTHACCKGPSGISVLIPARDEEQNIAAAIKSVLANGDVDFELLIGDDHSSDRTAEIIRGYQLADSRVGLLPIPPLPSGWNGKQHACWQLAGHAQKSLLLFIDADVRLEQDALSRVIALFQEHDAVLWSGVPRQITLSWMERMLIPLIHFVLLGYLPLQRMRASTSPAYSAGCGQLMVAARAAYFDCGGHAAVGTSMHDGLKLTATFRHAGYKTDLFDATPIATCRMYSTAAQVWEGLAKNATEGMATPGRLPLFSVLLFGGHVLPWFLLAWAALRHHPVVVVVAATATVLSYLPRWLAARRFQQPFLSSFLHPLGVLLLLTIQWYALLWHYLGYAASWKGRSYATVVAENSGPPPRTATLARNRSAAPYDVGNFSAK